MSSRVTFSTSGEHLEPLLDYGCSSWKTSSQRASDLYDFGVKLWRKGDLASIERQLAQSCTTEKFMVRRLDNTIVHITNPMFGIKKPIWQGAPTPNKIKKPKVTFQEYWHLVDHMPDGGPETYQCTYLVQWENRTLRNFEGPVQNVERLLELCQKRWQASATCEAFRSQFRKLLHEKEVTKIVCFGLGDMNSKPPEWWRTQNDSLPENAREPEISVIDGSLMHHAIAVTMADMVSVRAKEQDNAPRLLTQDPDYCDETKDIVIKMGFEVVGDYGAGGFAELTNECIVFSPFVSAPVKQIIADCARPVAIICAEHSDTMAYGSNGKPYADAESPRTKQMWKEYEQFEFPLKCEDGKLPGSLNQLVIHTRIK
ncbi:hypothetical protein F4808DRAFT_457883 [Astrocystis sublimbata]|nr:hypothetical protein F4808DRAFT_457883 [Astrocystis sublimbata]